MRWKLQILIPAFLLISLGCLSQYKFSGNVNPDIWEGDVYLSVVEDYRKISGIYPEQILAQTSPDSTGYFEFNGNNLPQSNRIYRIHIDNCEPDEQLANHFLGHCENSEEVLFIANNSDELELPFSFDQEMFCKVVSNNEKANTLLKIDSIKNDMKFAFGTYRSEANRKINSKKWFKTLQNYGELLNEPLAELYIFNFLSDPRSELHAYYLKDLSSNSYYDDLNSRLESNYPGTSYAQQFSANLRSDKVLIGSDESGPLPWWIYLLGIISFLSLVFNFYFFGKIKNLKRGNSSNRDSLSKQEQKVLDLILQDKTNKEIAQEMFVSLSTVKTHINNLYKKLNVSSRDEVKSSYSN